MSWIDITEKEKNKFNHLATHPLQSFEWGEFRKKTNVKVIRRALVENGEILQSFQLTLHPIPHTSWNIGYLPKTTLPTKKLVDELRKIGKQYNCIFIQLEPNVVVSTASKQAMHSLGLISSAHPLFTRHTFHIDLTQPDEELLKKMHQKTRYNIKVAQKHGVSVREENTQKSFDIYWKLTEETTKRQQFYAHSKKYHILQWETLPHTIQKDSLSSHLLFAEYEEKPLTAWIVFVFKDTLYYPYGASSSEHRDVMHSTLMMWEAMQFGKKHHLKTFDLWGAAAPNTPASDPWFGFTQFKERFGPTRVEFVGSYDLVIKPILYQGYKLADKLRWLLLRLRK